MKGRHSTITYEQAIELARDAAREAVREELSQLKRNSGSGLLGAIVSTTDPRMDGHITLADVFVSAAIPVGFTGFGVALAAGAMLAGAPFDDALTLMGRAVQIGGGLGALRLVGDVLNLGGAWYGTIGFILDWVKEWREGEPDEVDENPSVFGVDIEAIQRNEKGTGQVLRTTLLPELPHERVVEMLREAGRLVFNERKNFSKRGAGSVFGEYLSDVQTELLRLGLLKPAGKSPNAGYNLTHTGREWLARYL